MARPRSDIAARILRAAAECFLQDGVDGASLRAIATRARTSVGMVSYYHATKDSLFLAVVENTYARLLDDLARALHPDVAVPARIERMFARFGALTDEEHLVLRLVIREALVSSDRLARLLERFATGHVPLVIAAVLEGVQTGALTERHHPAVLAVATMMLALFPQIARQRLRGALPAGLEFPSGDALARALADVAMHGIAAREGPEPPPRGDARAGPRRRS